MTDVQDMSWDELVEKAKELGYEFNEKLEIFRQEYNIENLVNYGNENVNSLIFTQNGGIIEGGQYIVEGRTPAQMYQIMLALD